MLPNLKDLINRLFNSTSFPPTLLVIALVSVFVFQNDRDSFQPGHHGFLSSHGMTIAANLSPKHRFLMFDKMSREEDGTIRYNVYNRFPIGAFVTIRLLTLPFYNDLSMQISVARMLMNSFFVAAACFACLSIFRLTRSRWVAVTATLLAFSSYYCLYYNDMIFNDVPTLFGLLLTFHGMVVFVQDGRFTQLLIKTCAGLFFGWQVYAMLLPFTVLGCTKELIASLSVRSLVRSRFFILGVSSLLFGTAILTSNLAGEYLALHAPLRELPTFRMMLWRLGLADPESYDRCVRILNWPEFFKGQLGRIGRMSVPYILHCEYISKLLKALGGAVVVISLGGAVVVISLGGAAIARQRILIVSLVVSGLCWAIPMRHFVAFHDFQSIFYIGVPLAFFSMVALLVEKASKVLSVGFASTALLIFSLSCIHLNITKAAGADTEKNILTAEFQRIADHVGTHRTIFVDGDYRSIGGGRHAVGFYLAGNYFQPSAENAEFILSGSRIEGLSLLTPRNEKVFLYKGTKSEP